MEKTFFFFFKETNTYTHKGEEKEFYNGKDLSNY